MLRRHARAIAALACAAALPLLAAQPQFFRIEGARDFLDGDNEGVSVDSEGRLRLAPASRMLHDTEAPFLWCLARDARGTAYAGTGNDGKVFRVDKDGKAALAFDAPELEVHALAVGPDGRLFVGSSPDGKVYAVDAAGIGVPFFDPDERYIWALAFDGSGQLYVATGAEGKVYRVDPKGQAKALLVASDTHIMALAISPQGDVLAGSSPSGILYKVDGGDGKVSVLHDSAYREIKALDRGPDGSLYAAAVDGKAPEEPRPMPAPLSPPPAPSPSPGAPPAPEITVMESFALPPPAAPAPARGDSRAAGIKGALLRIWPTGEVETLWSSSDDLPHAVLRTDDGVLVATGNKGKLYRVREDRTWTMVAAFAAEQVTALLRADQELVTATSNPGKLFSLGTRPGTSGTFTSKVKDTDTVSTWGRIRWEAEVPAGTAVELQTRSGNTANPDSTWSEWSPAYTQKDGDPIPGDRARYLQVRAALSGKDGSTPVVDSISAAYLQRNLRPQVQSVTVHTPGEVFQKPLSVSGEIEILGLEPGEGPEARPMGVPSPRPAMLGQPTAYSRRLYQRGMQTFSWKADDPNGDTLVYDVQYRAVGDTKLRTLRRATNDTVLAWDTSTVPNGRYVIKVTARDTPGNPETLALGGDKESTPFDVDNTPPAVGAALEGTRVRATVSDDWSIIKKAEYSIDGGRWHEVHPVDGINDARQERYDITPGPFSEPGPHLLVVRATDLLGNVSSARVELK